MGRYAQARHRGRGISFASFTIPPPAPEDWTFENDAGSECVAGIVAGVCAVGADNFQLSAQLDPGTDPNTGNLQAAACDATSIIDIFTEVPQTANGFIRWMNGASAVSDWSAMKQTTVS